MAALVAESESRLTGTPGIGAVTAARLAKIANYNSGRLLGVTNMSTTSGAQVIQWADNGTADHLWNLTSR
jgi:hypothetical protein